MDNTAFAYHSEAGEEAAVLTASPELCNTSDALCLGLQAMSLGRRMSPSTKKAGARV